ncbi:hypothetical protein M271_33585 [Streptomyces rapamycinicus NRRL 5491]|nr:hypothetical protein M271_33585 [Streptomyces rapamycinicus NRRL 5491]
MGSALGELELLAGDDLVGVLEAIELGDLGPARAVAELRGRDRPQGVAAPTFSIASSWASVQGSLPLPRLMHSKP